MTPLIPDNQVQLAQLAVKQKFIVPEQVRAALELYRRYQAAGGDVPSVGRILVAKGWLDPKKAELLLRHMLKGEALPEPPPPVPANSPPPQPAVQRKQSPPMGNRPGLDNEFEILDDLGLEPPGSAIDLPVPPPQPVDEREELIKGLGATVVRKDLVKGYKITQVLGEGSMSVVYRAHQISMDRTVALKVLTTEKTKDQRFVEEFLAEARNAGRLNHPNLIRVHEVAKSGDTYYYSMEYIEGQRLDEWMDECEGGRLDPKLSVNVFIQAAQALDYGFRANVIHREIRPNTIMVNEDGQAKLADLGLTKDEHTRFLDGENAYYVAPEQVSGEAVDTRTDIYSLGCCLFHCLTGEPPFEGGVPKEVLYRRMSSPTPDPRELSPNVPSELSKVVMKMMARKPTDRFQTPAEVAEALKKVNFTTPTSTSKKMLPIRPLGKKPMLRPGRPGGSMQRPQSGRMGSKDALRRKRHGR